MAAICEHRVSETAISARAFTTFVVRGCAKEVCVSEKESRSETETASYPLAQTIITFV